ncbi:hypothetical protein GH714_001691 [Hevea brasiliensis]|uniref:2-(3-amino-3-carboxypropyl)histidine synthase subunit 1 n=1 Tax=Hevea brasiliensis TaxID=3981 RepID=A0A6A6MAU6_HEVBR|nr:hypothetical protein GH714_001691 [Hevea brasiliensis]
MFYIIIKQKNPDVAVSTFHNHSHYTTPDLYTCNRRYPLFRPRRRHLRRLLCGRPLRLGVSTIKLNLNDKKSIVLAGTIQFASAIREAKPELEKLGLSVLIPQSKPLSAGEVLGCTAPRIPSKSVIGSFSDMVVVFVADGRFHLEAFMMANPEISAFRNDPYLGKLFLEEYDHQGMKETRRGQ